MVKEPRPGRVKTRLGREIGHVAAAWWFRRQSAALVRRLRDPRWQLVLAVSPDRAGLASRVWPSDLARMPQGRGDLGERMARVFRSLPRGPAIVVGADVPGVTAAHIARAFAVLGSHNSVVGPATDGGYWLVGLKRTRGLPPRLFSGVRWSSETALADTLPTLPAPVATIHTLRDVDTAEDLAHLRRRSTS
ncbi:MAG: TIGR04282 family arsenosugar biosynthesis glycosyltransferase [Paracoccaceae bacterium]|nr:TIGR04282 family arsenosugar biosynthesis glycosyltransferase [Paracoccaceae bacterium]